MILKLWISLRRLVIRTEDIIKAILSHVLKKGTTNNSVC